MASIAQTLKYAQFLVKIEDQATPGTYVAPCGLNSRGFNRSAAMQDTNVPFCPPDEDLASWLERDVVSISAEISGAGVVADEDFDVWDGWIGGTSRNIEITLGTRKWRGAAMLASLNLRGERGQRTTFDVSMMSDGQFTRVST